MIFLVDGTGDGNVSTYQAAMATSFCNRFSRLFKEQAVYFRGPTWHGLETADIALAVKKRIETIPRAESVYLIGYSRGGAAVIEAANAVKRPIAAMFLFDAVNRDVRTETDTINGNVGFVYHGIRDPAFAKRFEAEAVAKQIELAKKLVTPIFMRPFSLPTVVAGIDAITATGKDLKHKLGRSRTFFGNTGRKANAPCRYKEKFFEGTHGALGGVHWPDVDGDEDCARKVGTWMLSCLMATGLKPIESLGT